MLQQWLYVALIDNQLHQLESFKLTRAPESLTIFKNDIN